MDRVGDRWWPVLGAVYLLVAVKRVRGMRLVGLARQERRKAAAAGRGGQPQRRRTIERPRSTSARTRTSDDGRVVIYTDGACKGNPGPAAGAPG
jgi:hypothetical protein